MPSKPMASAACTRSRSQPDQDPQPKETATPAAQLAASYPDHDREREGVARATGGVGRASLVDDQHLVPAVSVGRLEESGDLA